jgi:predicted kinase
VPLLLLLNGMPAVGKTTLARRYAADHPLTLVLDIDSVRRMLGRWEDDPAAAGLIARALTVAMAAEHLRGGRDVVVPQYLARPQFLDDLATAARDSGAAFAEVVLTDDRDTLFDRLARRTAAAAEPAHVQAGRQVAAAGGTDALMAMYDRLLLVLNSRPHAVVLHNPEGAAEDTYARLLARVGRRDDRAPAPGRLQP